jgi:hypothetical protein
VIAPHRPGAHHRVMEDVARALVGTLVEQRCQDEACDRLAGAITEAGFLCPEHLAARDEGTRSKYQVVCWATAYRGRWLASPYIAPLIDPSATDGLVASAKAADAS